MAIPIQESSTNGASARRKRFWAHFPGRDQVRLAKAAISSEREARQVLEEAEAGGFDGFFLTNRKIGFQKLLRIARDVAALDPKFFVGVHCLDLRPQDVFCRLPAAIRGVWTGPKPLSNAIADAANAIVAARRESAWGGLHLLGLTLSEESPESVASAIAATCDCAEAIALRAPRPANLEFPTESRLFRGGPAGQLPPRVYGVPASGSVVDVDSIWFLLTGLTVYSTLPAVRNGGLEAHRPPTADEMVNPRIPQSIHDAQAAV